ncbi:MAG: retropepsin-like domain-containing protein [Planctomycetes bacterium]|nr:retropepsin-like domain-containing protein [Armatimonadota bacterium]MBI3096813.1 retropepsin-like domain-containing protein [Planctomycetota bacterium]
MKTPARRHRRTHEAAAPAAAPVPPHLARIFREVRSNGSSFWTLFDSGSRRTYVTAAVAAKLGKKKLPEPVKRALGGRVHVITHGCMVVGRVEGYGITSDALVVDRLFPDEGGRVIDIILGMESMESWGINLDNTHKSLDFTLYAREAHEG